MDRDIYRSIDDALDGRKSWVEAQEYYRKLRCGGIRRSSKPFPGASDLWYPLVDTMIEKIKPSYIGQMYGGSEFATFVSLRGNGDGAATACGRWFDFMLKQRSNFEEQMFTAIDQMLESGFSVLKVYWDEKRKRVGFDQRDLSYIIVPYGTEEINGAGGADWMVDVMHLTVDEYCASDVFYQGEDIIKKISGKGIGTLDTRNAAASGNEGINYSDKDDEIILWEVYRRDRRRNMVIVETVSPLLPRGENRVRDAFVLPYNRGCFASGTEFPFFRLTSEIKDKGYYSPRGIAALMAPFEASLTHSWNAFHDHLSFSSAPTFEQEGAMVVPGGRNFRASPGAVLPPGLRMAKHPEPPVSLVSDMQMMRAVAEDRMPAPDLGLSQRITSGSKTATATQVNAVMAQSSMGIDMRSRIFRLQMGTGLKMAWSLYIQYASQDTLDYMDDGKVLQLDADYLQRDYSIVPNGSADNWNKQGIIQERLAFYQIFINNPFIKKEELTKWVMEGKDPGLVKRLYNDPGINMQEQGEEQAVECLLMLQGYQPLINEADDDKAHLVTLVQFAQDKTMRGIMTRELAELVVEHGRGHIGAMKAKKNPEAHLLEKQLEQMAAIFMAAVNEQERTLTQEQASVPAPAPVSTSGGIA